MYNLTNLINEGLELHADGKTFKNLLDKPDYKKKLNNLMYTVEIIRASVRNNKKIDVNGDKYELSDYQLFGGLDIVVRCGVVWATEDSKETCDPYFEAAMPVCGKHDDGTDFRAMTPDQVEAFINAYNKNQPDGYRLEKRKLSRDTVTVSAFKGWEGQDKEGTIVYNDSGIGSIDERIAVINHVKSPFDSKFVSTISAYSSEVMSKWLIWQN